MPLPLNCRKLLNALKAPRKATTKCTSAYTLCIRYTYAYNDFQLECLRPLELVCSRNVSTTPLPSKQKKVMTTAMLCQVCSAYLNHDCEYLVFEGCHDNVSLITLITRVINL